MDASSAYNDVAVAAIAFTLFYLLQIWDERRSSALLVAVGVVAGFAYGIKYTAGLAVPYALALVAWRSRKWRDVAIVAACAGLIIAPWMIKDWLWYQNPVAPFFNHWFPNQYVTSSFEAEYRFQLAHPSLSGPGQIPLQVTTFGSLSGQLGPVFLLAPVCLLALRLRQGRQLLLAAAVFGAPFFSNVSARFLLPALPFVAMAMAMVLARAPRMAVGVVVLHALLSWPPVLRAYSHADAWHLNKVTWREALRIKPEDGFLESNLPLYGAARLVERATRARRHRVHRNAHSGGVYHAPHPHRLPIRRQHRQPRHSLERLRARLRSHAPAALPLPAANAARGSRGPNQYRRRRLVHARNPRFRWRPRTVARYLARRGAAVAMGHRGRARRPPRPRFWECGETLRAGQFVAVDFGATVEADAVVIEAAPNQAAARLRLEALADSGFQTVTLAESPEISDAPVPPDLRRQAAAELRRRGNDYLLVFDGEFGADDLRARAADWGIREIATI